MQPGLVSIMMPAFNAEKYIARAIESAITQTYLNWELIIVNDGSKDRTAEIATGYADPRMRIFHQTNSGEASARNTALEQVRGEFLAFLDADDEFLPEHLHVTVNYLQSHPDRDGVYTDGSYCDQDGHILKPLSSRRRGPFEGDIFEEVMLSSDVFGAPVCVVLRIDPINKNHLLFDSEIVIGPDWDFLTQFAAIGQFSYVPQKTCLYRVHLTNISIRTGMEKRAQHLARCRENTIKMDRFGACSIESRTFVFYDLLINLLKGNPERQAEIIRWKQFLDLPVGNRSNLYRWMASKSILRGEHNTYIKEWLMAARDLNPSDYRASVTNLLYNIHPRLCKLFLSVRTGNQGEAAGVSPFSDLFPASLGNES
jgi:glycosyltransferase involved in cell wall biosynthesis